MILRRKRFEWNFFTPIIAGAILILIYVLLPEQQLMWFSSYAYPSNSIIAFNRLINIQYI